MTFGHHGVFSLSPIFLFSLYGALKNAFGKGRSLRAISRVTLLLTVAMLAFYTWNPKARNYGGSTSGLRWLFWLIHSGSSRCRAASKPARTAGGLAG